MNKLTQAFVAGRKLKDYTFTAWNEKAPPTASKMAYDDYHASCLAILLAEMPRTKDMKIRQEAITEIADQLTELHFTNQ